MHRSPQRGTTSLSLKPVSRYLTKRNKKTVTERIEKKKYNPFLKRHTLHKEIK